MHRNVLLVSGIVLLGLFCSFTRAQDLPESEETTESTTSQSVATTHEHTTHPHTTHEHTTHPHTTHEHTTHPHTTHEHTTHAHTTHGHTTHRHTTKVPKKTTKKSSKRRKNQYGSYGSDSKYRSGGRGRDDDSYEVVGRDGIDPSRDGTDFGDFGPIRDNKKSMLSSLDVWISSANDWKHKDKSDEDDDNDKSNYGSKGNRGKRSYKKIHFPVKRVKNYRKFPIKRFPPLISIFPWVPIFYDKITYQTIIFSPTGGLYIIPPLINFYGQRFAVAQLIKWGYASLVSSGDPVGPGLDVAPLVQPPPPPPPAGVPVVAAPVAGPVYNSNKGRFVGGVKTDFRDFKPRYSQTLEEEGGSNYAPAPARNVDTNYGGTRNQQVYPQGGY